MAEEANRNITLILIFILVTLILFSPNLTKFPKESGIKTITGMAQQQTAILNISVGNNAPKICCPRLGTKGAQAVNLDSKRSISVLFNVSDIDGNSGLKAFGNLTGQGATAGIARFVNYNLSCVYTGKSNATSKEFNCSAPIWYYFRAGRWNISVNATDGTNKVVTGKNYTEIVLAQSIAITIGPSSLTWASVNLGADNQTSNNDPVTINNTGNYNVSISKVNVTAYDLHGEAVGYESQKIPAANFTVDVDDGGGITLECDGTAMANKTSINIVNSILPLGNHSLPDGKTAAENLSFCLIDVPLSNMITAGKAYSTAETAQWIIGVS